MFIEHITFYIAIILFFLLLSINSDLSKTKREVENLKKQVRELTKTLSKLSIMNNNQPEEPKEQEFVQENIIDTIEDTSTQESINIIPEQNKTEPNTQYQPINSNIEISNNKNNSFEKMFLGNIFNIIGAIAIIISCGFFIKLISDVITPEMKIAAGFIAGILMILGGLKIKSDKLKKYSEILTGTGFSVLFITVFCTTALFEIFTAQTSSIIGAFILIAAYITADKNKTSSLPVISLFGGYLNILLAAKYVDTPYIFGYLLFLNIISLIFVYRNSKSSWINPLNLSLTLLYLAIFRNLSEINIIYPLILWAIYIIYNLAKTEQGEYQNKQINLLNWMNIGVLTIFSSLIFSKAKTNIGILLLFIGIAYCLIISYYILKQSPKAGMYVNSLLLAILISTFFLTSGIYSVISWSVEALLLGCIIKFYKLDFIKNWTITYILAAMTKIFFIPEILYIQNINAYTPFMNERLAVFSVPMIASFINSFLLIKEPSTKNTANIFKFIGLSLLFLYIVIELNNYLSLTREHIRTNVKIFTKTMYFTIVSLIYSIQLDRLAKSSQMKFLNFISKSIFWICLILLPLSGASYLPLNSYIPILNIRFAAFMLAISASVIFAQKSKLDFYKYIAVAICFLLLHFEINDIIYKYHFQDYLISIGWIFFAGIITLIGIFKNKKYLKTSGIIISIISVIRIFLYDLANVDIGYKIISFITLGAIFMIISYFYNKNQK